MKKQNSNSIWLYGKHPVFLAIEKKSREISQILVTKNSLQELEKFIEKHKLFFYKNKIKIVENSFLNSIVGDVVHQGLALNCSLIPLKSQNALLDEIQFVKPHLLIMDQLTDPHNIGAIIRSACAFGFTKIIFCEHNFAKESAVMNKASSGMIENVDLFLVGNLNNLLEKLKENDYWCIGLAGESKETITKAKEFKNVALIIGSEGDGIRKLVKQNCDLLVKIPMLQEV